MKWIIIIIAIIIVWILIRFFMDLKKQGDTLKAQGGVRKKYGILIDTLLGSDPGCKILKETNMSITLGRSDKACAECYDITQGIGTVIVQYYINHIISGKHKLEMSFPDNMNPSSMIEEIDRRVRDFHMRTMRIEEEVKDLPNSHEYVDLGLSVKWATCNVGANSPEEYGDYFAWGELREQYSGCPLVQQ